MVGTDNITIESVKQNTAFINIKAFLECNANTDELQILYMLLPDIARMVRHYYQKYDVSLDDLIAEAFFAFAVRLNNYPDTSHYKDYSKANICSCIRSHIIRFCKTEIKTQVAEKQKQERYIKYMK